MWEPLRSSLPFALAAAFYPAGLLTVAWLLGRPRGQRHAVSYLVGAALTTFASGVIIAVLMRRTGRPSWLGAVQAAIETGTGALLVVTSAWLVARKPRLWATVAHDERSRDGGAARSFLLGVAMWMPSLAYVAALERIVAGEARPAVALVDLVLVDVIVLSFIEAPLLLYALAPGLAAKTIRSAAASLARLGWAVTAALCGLGGLYLLARGWAWRT
jgi:hypothetical protein